jgi:hypothetical protein
MSQKNSPFKTLFEEILRPTPGQYFPIVSENFRKNSPFKKLSEEIRRFAPQKYFPKIYEKKFTLLEPV